jgi:hypothetical protein
MRLPMLERGGSVGQRLAFKIVRSLVGQVPGPILAMSYRRRQWGKPFSACLQQAMRGPSHFSIGECELFAAFVSRKNQCPY